MPKHILLTRTQALSVARAALHNARTLRRSSELSAENRIYGAATALAVLAAEEAAKSLQAYLFAFGGDAKLETWGSMFRQHRPKQAIAFAGACASECVSKLSARTDKLRARLMGRYADRPENERAEAAWCYFQRYLERVFRTRRVQLEGYAAVVQARWSAVVEDGELDDIKKRGFYVDFDPDTQEVLDPRAIGQSEFERQRADLQALMIVLDTIDGLAVGAETVSELDPKLRRQSERMVQARSAITTTGSHRLEESP
jgi:AbiV family abortive infection protein